MSMLQSLLGARTLLGAPGLTTRSKTLLGSPGIATRSKDATTYFYIVVFLYFFGGPFFPQTKKVNLDAKSIFNSRLPLKKCVHVMLHLSSSAQRQIK